MRSTIYNAHFISLANSCSLVKSSLKLLNSTRICHFICTTWAWFLCTSSLVIPCMEESQDVRLGNAGGHAADPPWRLTSENRHREKWGIGPQNGVDLHPAARPNFLGHVSDVFCLPLLSVLEYVALLSRSFGFLHSNNKFCVLITECSTNKCTFY